ncbi:hypothetical protein [Acidithiobacillus sp.]
MVLGIAITAYNLFVIGYAGILTGKINAYRWRGTMPGPLLLLTWIGMFLTGPLLLIVALPLRLLGIRMFPVFTPLPRSRPLE